MAQDTPFKFTEQQRPGSSQPKPASGLPSGPEGHSLRSSPGYSRLNSALGVFVALAATLAAIPVGLNRPALWLAWTGIVAFVALAYLVIGWRLDRQRPLLSARHPWLFLLAFLIPVYAFLQGLPGLGALAGQGPIPDGLTPSSISLMPEASQLATLRFVGYIFFAGLVIEVASRTDRARRIGWLLFWGAVAHAVWALVALNMLGDIHIWGDDKTAYLGSATGTFVNRNSFATFLAMGSVLGLALLLETIDKPVVRKARVRSFLTPDRLDVVMVCVGLGLIWIALLSTQSRMGVFSGAIGMIVCFAMMRAKAGAPLWRTLVVLGGIGVVAGGLVLVYGLELLWRTVFVGDASSMRADGYVRILGLIGDRPFLGYGFDAFRPAFELVHVAPMNTDVFWARGHSTYLTHWSELGLVIGSLPLVIGVLALRRLLATVRSRERDYALGVAGVSAITVAAVHSLVDFSLEMPANVVFLLAIVGLGLAHRRAPKSSEPATKGK